VTTATEVLPVPPGLETPHHVEHQVRVGAAWKLIGQFGIQVIRLATVAVLARLLAPTDYGMAATAIALATYAPTVGDMAIGAAVVQSATLTRVQRSTAFWSAVGFGAVLSVLAFAVAGPIGNFLGDPRIGQIVAVGGLTFACCGISSTSQAVFMREMQFRTIELRYWVAVGTASAVSIIAAVLGAGAWALVLQQVVLFGTFAVTLWWRAGWHPTFEFSRAEFRELCSFALRVAGGRWARLIELLVLTLLVGKLLSVSELGAWSFAMSTVIVPLTVLAVPISEVLFSAFSRLRGDRERVATLWLSSFCQLAAVVLPVLVGLMVVAPDVIPTAFGAHWQVSVAIVQILSVSIIFRSLRSWNSVVMDALGKPQATAWTQLAALCSTPVAAVVGAHWGVQGVAACYVVCQLFSIEIPLQIIVLRSLKVSPATVAARVLGLVGATLAMAAACAFGRQVLIALDVGMASRSALVVAIGCVSYAVALRLLAPNMWAQAVGAASGALNSRRRSVASA
jgi:O-antigen/teichoic acid export membrane protein